MVVVDGVAISNDIGNFHIVMVHVSLHTAFFLGK